MRLGLGLDMVGQGTALFEPTATLALAFTTGQYRVGAGGYSTPDFASLPGLTVTRASTKYAQTSAGVLVQFGSGVAAITDQGLLVEEARTNLLLQSQTLATAPWGGTATRTNAAGAAPDGANTACSIAPVAQFSGANQTVSVAANTAYTATIYLKLSSGNSTLTFQAFDTTNSVFLVTASKVITSSWARYTINFTTGATTANVQIGIQDNNASGMGVFLAWGAQLELGAFATSYIPTTSASVTRAADVVSIGGLSLVSPYALVGWGAIPAGLDGTRIDLATVHDGTANNRVELQRDTDNKGYIAAVAGGVYQTAPSSAGTFTGAQTLKFAGTIATTERQAFGGAATASATITVPTGISTVALGKAQGAASWLNGYLQKLVIYPAAFSDAQLQALTS